MLSELDQMETDWMGCMESRDPEAVAEAYRLLGHHMQLTIQQLGMVISVTEAERELEDHGCGSSARDDHRGLSNKKVDP